MTGKKLKEQMGDLNGRNGDMGKAILRPHGASKALLCGRRREKQSQKTYATSSTALQCESPLRLLQILDYFLAASLFLLLWKSQTNIPTV